MGNDKNQQIHVCIVTTAHPVDDVRVNSKFAQAFVSAGFRVSWVGPGHAFFDPMDYDQGNIQFVLAPPIRTKLDRILALSRIKKLAQKIPDVDIYYAPDPDSAPLAIQFAKQNHAKVVFDIHEVYHGALLDRWLLGCRLEPIREIVRRKISRTCSRCDLVLGVSNAVLDPYFTDATRRMVVRSCAPSWFADGPPADVCGADRPNLTFMHGKADLLRGTLKVSSAAVQAAKEGCQLRVIMFVNGDPAEDPAAKSLLSKVKEGTNMEVLDLRKGVPMQEIPDILRSCDVGLIAYGRDLGIDSLPNRLFEYMAMGLPVIAPKYSVEIAKIIDAEECGILADFEDPDSIAVAILQLHENRQMCREMGRRGRAAFLARHNWEVEVRPVLDRMRSWFPEKGA